MDQAWKTHPIHPSIHPMISFPLTPLAKPHIIPQLTSRPIIIIIIRLISIRIHPPPRPIQILHPINILIPPSPLLLFVLLIFILLLALPLLLFILRFTLIFYILLLRLIPISQTNRTSPVRTTLHPLRGITHHLDILVLVLAARRRRACTGGGGDFRAAVGIGLLGLALAGFDLCVGFEFFFEAGAEGVEF